MVLIPQQRGGVTYGDGTNYATTSAGTSGQVLTSNGSSAPTYSSSLVANFNINSLLETATVSASAPTATTTYDVNSQAVQYYTSNTTTNFTLNIRGNSTTALNSVMAIGQSATIALIVTNSTTAYYPNVIQVDGTTVTVKWQGGTAVTSGNASALDVYSFTVIKTANATFTVLGSQSKFA